MTVEALTFEPGNEGTAAIEEISIPGPDDGMVVDVLAVGVCGTDHELLRGEHGRPPPNHRRMVLGHESLCRVAETPREAPLQPGDLVVAMVRHPDPVPCRNCSIGEWDMCTNGGYTEHGIMGRDGFMATQARVDPNHVVVVPSSLGANGVLVEPASVVTKAWEHIEAIGSRGLWEPKRALITGAGPIGLLAALLARQRGLDVTVFDRVTEGPKPGLAEALGAVYHVGELKDVSEGADIVIECTGVASLVFDVLDDTARNGIVCLTGVTSPHRMLEIPAGVISRQIVLENDVVFGSVNANRRHYEKAIGALSSADAGWLGELITRRVALDDWGSAFTQRENDIKVVIEP